MTSCVVTASDFSWSLGVVSGFSAKTDRLVVESGCVASVVAETTVTFSDGKEMFAAAVKTTNATT